MTLTDPVWLALALPLGAALFLWAHPSRLVRALRLLTCLAILFALAGLAIRLPSRAGTVVVVADRSASMPAGAEALQKEIVDLVHAARPGDGQLGVVSFAESVAVDQAPQPGKFPGFLTEVGHDASNLADALEAALALIPRDSPGRILVLSDGRWTGRDPLAPATAAASRGVALDYRPVGRPAADDLAIDRIDAPATIAPKESFVITAWVRAPTSQDVSFELTQGRSRVARGKRALVAGLNRLTFRDQAEDPGVRAYTLTVTGAAADPVPENNTARVLVGVEGRRPLLYVTPSNRTGVPRLLQAGGLRVKVAAPAACDWTLEGLSQYAGVLLENVPADKLGGTALETLAAWVRDTGAGLMLTGGQSSYAPGGYYGSPLDPILPVSMELREEHRKFSLAIVVALDRSGSMSMPVAGGRQKMDLADLGTAQVLDLLSPADEFGVIAVDTVAHVVADLGHVKDKNRVRNDVLRIKSEGGGIYIHEALESSLQMLARARAGTRHIILFADAADSDQHPGQYRHFLDECRKAGITVSVIGLGTPVDKDAQLLHDVARLGGGQIYFTDKPEELPRLFAQDTFVVARSTFLDEPTPFRATAGLTALAGRPFGSPPALGGYNLCYLREGASLAAVTLDEYEAPVVAAWQAGLGRVLCYTGEADGKFTGPIGHWRDLGDFYTSLARWTVGRTDQFPQNMLVTQRVQAGLHTVQLHLDPDRKGEPFSAPPTLTLLHGPPGRQPQTLKTELAWTGPDTLAAQLPLAGTESAIATVDIPSQGPVSLPPVCLPYSPEFQSADTDAGPLALDHLARATAGKERIELAAVWKDLPRRPRLVNLAPWLLAAAICLLLVEVLERRTSLVSHGRIPRLRSKGADMRSPSPDRTQKPVPSTVTSDQPTSAAPSHATGAAAAPSDSADAAGMLHALRQARQQTRRRRPPSR